MHLDHSYKPLVLNVPISNLPVNAGLFGPGLDSMSPHLASSSRLEIVTIYLEITSPFSLLFTMEKFRGAMKHRRAKREN